ncbi:MAG: palindromic element RPE1 domain-containing protein [Rickettsia endosymbiont of Cimex lectularius]|nr:MAG: palindromic element RPE1 domain-containing protein [Rickettsia endosymbiont of Cimex lectularius]
MEFYHNCRKLVNIASLYIIRLLSKLAYAEGFEGDAERRTAAYSDVREDSSTASTYKSPAEVEFRKKSIARSCEKAATRQSKIRKALL